MKGKIPISPLPELTGIPEGALRLLISVLCAYPVGYIYRKLVLPRWSSQPAMLNMYHVVMGLAMSYFFNGLNIIHSLITVIVTQLLAVLLASRAPNLAAGIIFVWNFGYLLAGYWTTQTEKYDVGWTCPQCVLCLKLIGYGIDLRDNFVYKHRSVAEKKTETIKEKRAGPGKAGYAEPIALFDDASSPISQIPSFIQLLGFSYHPLTFLVGPQLSYAYYQEMLARGLLGAQDPTELAAGTNRGFSRRSGRALSRFILGVLYLAGNQLLALVVPVSRMHRPEAASWSMLYRIGYMIVSHKGVLMRYLGIWSLTEGACVLAGMGYNGLDASGKSRWDGLANVNPASFETSTNLANIINTFNINTNRWSKRYIFKRLRFLGSKHLSALGTLLFLAIWHGFHPGYLLCFGMEFIDMEAERRLLLLWRSIKGDQTFTAPVRILLSLIGWLWTFFHLSYGLSAMEQRTFDNAWRYWQRLYFLGFWISITGIVLSVLLTPLIQRSTTPDKAFVKPTQPKPQASARTT